METIVQAYSLIGVYFILMVTGYAVYRYGRKVFESWK